MQRKSITKQVTCFILASLVVLTACRPVAPAASWQCQAAATPTSAPAVDVGEVRVENFLDNLAKSDLFSGAALIITNQPLGDQFGLVDQMAKLYFGVK